MKDNYVRIRMSDRDKEIIKEQSNELQMSMSEYILYLVRKDADERKKR